jgi:S1-C subfamily serine protease
VSAYYGLGIDSGALVTDVAKGGLIEKAGVKAGDVITAFNGTKIGADTPLLGMMRGCCIDEGVTLEVWSSDYCRFVEINSETIRTCDLKERN